MFGIEPIYIVCALLPIAALSGWYLAKKSNNNSSSLSSTSNPNYLQGLNFVLNEQPDKAIEVFIKIMEVDSDTVETHLALGNLFRRRGEVDRAIRIHQNLIARPNLQTSYRDQALLELAKDYMASGLLDRAESLFKQLIESKTYSQFAYKGLLDIYQQEKDWENAIISAKHLELNGDKALRPIIAQFYCELADKASESNNLRVMKENIKRAFATDKTCIRAFLLDAKMLTMEEKYKNAIKVYKQIEKQSPDYLFEILKPMFECYTSLDKLDDFKNYLKELVKKHGSEMPLLMLTEMIAKDQGHTEALEYLTEPLNQKPTLRGLDRYLHHSHETATYENKDKLLMLKNITTTLISEKPIYQCKKCGFSAKAIHWHCPGCKSWLTIKPIKVENVE